MLGTSPTYRAMLALDIEKSAGRGDVALLRNRDVLDRVAQEALAEADVTWDDCHRTDLGDGVLLVIGQDVRKAKLVHPLASGIALRLRAHNRNAAPREVIRVRMALHAGDVHIANGAVAGGSLEDLSRLLDAPPLRRVLAAAPKTVTVALLVSQHMYAEVVRHGYDGIDPATFFPVRFTVKETTSEAWVHLPGHTPDQAVLASGDPTGDRPSRQAGGSGTGQSITAQYVNLAQDHAQVGEQVGSVGTRIDHVTGDVHLGGDRTPSPDLLRRQLVQLRRALVTEQRAGRLDDDTYEAAADELRTADLYLSRTDGTGSRSFVLALKRLKGLLDGVADLAGDVATILDTARGRK